MADITVAICNFNTTELTNACIQSIVIMNRALDIQFTVLDNSNTVAYSLDGVNALIKVIDNTKEKFIDFDKLLDNSPFRVSARNTNKFGSFKHAASIQFLLDICTTDKMILCDSDTIAKYKFDFIGSDAVTVADLQKNGTCAYEDERRKNMIYTSKTRFLPYVQLFNVKKMNELSLKYFDYSRIHGVLSPYNGNYYDTGASLYEDCIKQDCKFEVIDYHKYMKHLGQGSWKKEFIKSYASNKQI